MSSAQAEQHLLEQEGLGKTEAYRFDRARVYIERCGRQAKMEAIKHVVRKLKKWRDIEAEPKRRRQITDQMKAFAQQYKQIEEIEAGWKGAEPIFSLDLKGKVYGNRSV